MHFGCLWLFGNPECLVRSQIKRRLKVVSLTLNRGGSIERNCSFRVLAVSQVKIKTNGVRQSFDQLILQLWQNSGQIYSGHVLNHVSPPEVSSALLTPFFHTKCLQYPVIMMKKTTCCQDNTKAALLWVWEVTSSSSGPFSSGPRPPRTEHKTQAVGFGHRTTVFLIQSLMVAFLVVHKTLSLQERAPYSPKHWLTNDASECVEDRIMPF